MAPTGAVIFHPIGVQNPYLYGSVIQIEKRLRVAQVHNLLLSAYTGHKGQRCLCGCVDCSRGSGGKEEVISLFYGPFIAICEQNTLSIDAYPYGSRDGKGYAAAPKRKTLDREARRILFANQRFNAKLLIPIFLPGKLSSGSDDILAVQRIVKAIQRRGRLQSQVHFPVAEFIASAPALRLHGKVRGLLYFQNQTARTDGVDHTGIHEKYIPGFYRNPIDHGCHAGLILLALCDKCFEILFFDFFFEAEINACAFPRIQDDPGLRLSVGTAKVFAGESAGGMYLHGQTDGTIKEFDKDAQILPFPQVFLFVFADKFIKGHTVFFTERNSFQRIGASGVDCLHGRADPFFREIAVTSLIARKGIQKLSSEINTKHAVFSEENRVFPGSIRNLHNRVSFLWLVSWLIIASTPYCVKPLDKIRCLWYFDYGEVYMSVQAISGGYPFCQEAASDAERDTHTQVSRGEGFVRIFQKGFNYSQDGPGNRLVYHLQGCNLHCPWCANPEGLPLRGGVDYTIAALVDEVISCKMMFFDGGGVTLTGGEVTVQPEEVREFLSELHRLGIHTCIETNGVSDCLEALFPLVDYLIMDIKHYDSDIHKAVIGVGNRQIVKNIQLALSLRTQLALRIPLIGGFNATCEDARGFCRLFDALGVNENVTLELLPYHEYGRDKYKKLGKEYRMSGDAFVGKDTLREIEDIFRGYGIRLIKT